MSPIRARSRGLSASSRGDAQTRSQKHLIGTLPGAIGAAGELFVAIGLASEATRTTFEY
jgi:hypothetical protein